MNAVFNNLEFFRNMSRDGMTVKSYDHNNPRHFIQVKPGMYGCKLWSVCVQVGTASCTRMVDLALVTAWLNYRQVYGTDALDLLDLQRAVPAPSQNIHLPKAGGMTFCHCLLVILDLMVRAIFK